MSQFKSFKDLAVHLRCTQMEQDRLKAAKLKRAANLPKPKPGTGPRVAR
jgi:hypothetical protein